MLAAAVTVAAVALVVGVPPPPAWPVEMWRAGALTLIAIVAWAFGALPHGAIAAGYLALIIALGVATPDAVLAGLRSSVFWLVAAGIMIGFAIGHTGLGERIARRSIALVGGSYLGIVAGVAATGALLAFVMPSSMGRVLTLIPIVVAIADRCGFEAGSRGRAGLVIAAAAACFLPAGGVLTALMPNVLLAGAAEANYGLDIAYGRYLVIHYPVMGVLRTAAIAMVAAAMFKEAPRQTVAAATGAAVTDPERFLASVLALTLGLWLTDGWHSIAPGWIAAGAALTLLAGGRHTLPLRALARRFDIGALLYVLAVVAMGRVVVDSGLAARLGERLDVLPLGVFGPAADVYVLSSLAAVAGLLVTNPAVPAVLSPVAAQLAAATGLSLEAVLMTQALGFSNVILPYQASPVLVAMLMTGTSVRACTRFTLVMTLVSFGVLLPLEIAWWGVLGVL